MPYRHESVEGKTRIIAENHTLPTAFADAATAAWALVIDPESVKGSETRARIVVEAQSRDDLLGSWIKAVLEQSEIDGLLFSEFRVSSIQEVSSTQYLLTGEAWGEAMDPARHHIKRNPKELLVSDAACTDEGGMVTCHAMIS